MKRRLIGIVGVTVAMATPVWVSRQLRGARPSSEPAAPSDWRGIVLPDLQGRPRSVVGAPLTVVNIWARWCAPCRRELPALQGLAARLAGRSVEVLTIALDDDAFALREYVRDIGFALPVLLGDTPQMPKSLRPAMLPQTVVLDPAGAVLRRVIGARDWSDHDARRELLAGTLAA